jgi:hypothetical protein
MIKDTGAVTPFPTGPGQIVPCPMDSYISTRYFMILQYVELVSIPAQQKERSSCHHKWIVNTS